MSEDATDIIATIRKNDREDVRVSLTEFNGVPLVDVRAWLSLDGDYRPTRKGVCLNIVRLPALIEALNLAREAAERRGLIR